MLLLASLLLLVRHLLLEAMHLFLVASCYYERNVTLNWRIVQDLFDDSGMMMNLCQPQVSSTLAVPIGRLWIKAEGVAFSLFAN